MVCHSKRGIQAEGVRENRVVKKVFGPKDEGVAGGAGKIHNKLLFYYLLVCAMAVFELF